jgi:hypothetical protein
MGRGDGCSLSAGEIESNELTVANVILPSSLVTESKTFNSPARVTADLRMGCTDGRGLPSISNSTSSSTSPVRTGKAQSISSRSRMLRAGVSDMSLPRLWSSILKACQ